MSTLTTASHQWATRPPDQRFTSLTELDAFVSNVRKSSHAKVLSSKALSLAPVEEDSNALVCIGPNGGPVNLTHWSFGQLAQLAGAPAGYLRGIPAPLAADCMNFGFKVTRDASDVGVLLYKNGGPAELRAATGPNYGRIWNETITHALVNRFGDGITGDFRVPGEFGKAIEVTKDNTTLYASDRDMFVFLADEQHRIEIPNRRNGEPGSLARGFFVWNSEVGSATFGIATFLFDYVCCNRMVWGSEQYAEVRIRHTASAPDRWLDQVQPAITAFANSSASSVTEAIEAARAGKIGDKAKVDAFLASRFTRSQVSAIKAAHLSDEQKPIQTLWDAAVSATAYARGIQYQDERVRIEREAGKIMSLAK